MKHLTRFARDIEAICAHMNAGLAAVALVLALFVMTMSAIRAQELVPEVLDSLPGAYPLDGSN